tara:strand:- start:389 stop:577 length:189 start_codon:yes stop_codon:yes gene_type:complete
MKITHSKTSKIMTAISDIEIYSIQRSKMIGGRIEFNMDKLDRYEGYIAEAKDILLNLANGSE